MVLAGGAESLGLCLSPSLPGRRLAWIALLGTFLGVLALAGLARFYDLGGAPLAEDEYYSTRGIEWILADGLPAIPGGGYYARAPLYQYLAAGFAQLFGADAFAYRLPSAIFGLLAGVVGFFYARRFGGPAVGLAVAAALLLSSWEIEFSRLVRFYTLFQVILLLFLIALDKAYFEARAGWRYVPHAALLLAALAHEMAALLAPLLFLPLLPNCTALRLREPRRWLGFALVSVLITLIVAEMTIGLGLRDSGVVDRYPDGYEKPARFGGPFATPVLPFFRLFSAPILHLFAVCLVGAALVLGFLIMRGRGTRQLEVPDLLLALALLAGLFHLFAAMGLVLVFAFARYDLWHLAAQPRRRLVLMGTMLAVVLGWLAVVATAPERLVTEAVVTRWNMDVTQPSELGATLRALWSTFFGWPDFYRLTLRPFAAELPELGFALLLALVWFIVAHRHDPMPDLLRHPGAIVLYWMLAMALFDAGSSTSRYSFPLLPVLYTLIAVSLAEILTRWWPDAELAARRGASLAFLLLFALGPDFNPSHILDPGDDAVRYRTGPFARFAETWYPRLDVRMAAETLARRHAEAPGTRIVVDSLPAMSYYLDVEHAIYYHRGWSRFEDYSRERGRRDMWSGHRLLSTPEELSAYAEPAEELWLVGSIERIGRTDTDLAAAALADGQLIEVGRDILGQDGRIELIRLRHR
jgi:Dolichyl-phosphate-mannose-protein mannosyltransferase